MPKAVSFVVPAYNESCYIEACIRSILRSFADQFISFQIIVVDNGSDDSTAEIARTFPIEVFSIARNSVAFARNYGAKKAKHPIIAFIDGDVEITDEWASCLSAKYNDFLESPGFITGHQCIVPETGSWIEQHWFKNIKDQLLGGANIITSRQAFDDIGGFDESLKTGEDYDFCQRYIQQGMDYSTDPEFKAIHLGFPHTLKGFLKREYWHGEGDFKSFARFRRSIVAIIAVTYLALLVALFLSALMEYWRIASSILVALAALNLAITLKRFSQCPVRTILVNYFLNFCYFLARIGSLFRMLKNRALAY
jgi:glycosyltransferase involved in cell wall biosynthesis